MNSETNNVSETNQATATQRATVDYSFPPPSARMLHLFRRNFLVWRKLYLSSLMTHLAEPFIFFVGFGLGVGALIGDIDGENYLEYIAGGLVCYGVMNGATFEGLYSAFTRMHVQRTWESILNAPITLDDVIYGEWLWAGFKGMMAGGAMLLIITLVGFVHFPMLPVILLVLACTTACFASIALAFNAVAKNYEFFSYYFTLFITPMMLVSGTFFPISTLPAALQTVAHILPLSHAVEATRLLLKGDFDASVIWAVAVLLLYTIIGFWVAVALTRRRLVK